MRRPLILLALIASLGSFQALAQSATPVPAPAPVRNAEGQFVAGAEEQSTTDGGEIAGDDIGDGQSAEDNPAAQAAEEAARAAALRLAGGAPQSVTLSAKLTDDGPVIPSGVNWRIYSADSSDNGDVKLVARSDQATAVVSLEPGEYLTQAIYGFAQASDTVTITDAPEARLLVLDAGALRLNARVTGGTDIPAEDLKFEIYPQGQQDDPRQVLATNVYPGEVVHLNAGIYHVISTYGAVNAKAETDLRVDKGQLTDATLFHDAAAYSFRLVSEIGGEAIADIDWTIKDAAGQTVYRYTGTFPSAILAKGDYVVLAERGTTVYNRDFSVLPGPGQEIEVLTSL
jgi:hypothetical protein